MVNLIIALNTALIEGILAAFIAVAFAMLFASPSKVLAYIAFGGFITRFCRSFLYTGLHFEIVIACFCACAIMSLLFIYISPKLGVPRPVFTVASIISLIPGMDVYHALISLIQLIDNPIGTTSLIYTMFHHATRCFSIMLAIALGIAIPPLFFYRYRYAK